MPTLLRTTTLPVEPDQIWSVIKGFDELASWHPRVPPSEMEESADPTTPGAVRRFIVDGNVVAREELIEHDNSGRTYSYEVLDQPLPVKNYIARIEVVPTPDGSEVRWTATYDGGDEIIPVVENAFGDNVYLVGLDALRDRFDGR
ncbi:MULTISPECIES: SRPBCC family protein [Rhodococcus]|uniref:SRPBCC family protein n=1 Tax=Rhodococcus TaxID=1827 RepID=UPI001142C82B|nr:MULTISPECIES: SRPBCC family protein [Rhodococcus]QXW00556.1 SRPBCC family protein [Rhodococcus globerulus]ROZ50448.1 SRPBCC family protein [Rhodococcus sp. WS3]